MFLLRGEVVLKEKHDFVVILRFKHLLEQKHLVANLVANLNVLLLVLEFLPPTELEDHLTLLICAFVFFAPLFVVFYPREEHQLITVVTGDLQNLDELLQDVGARTDPQLARALVGTVLGPLLNTLLAKQLPAVVAFHRVNRNFEADAANQRILKLLVHFSVLQPLDIVASLVVALIILICQIHQLLSLSFFNLGLLFVLLRFYKILLQSCPVCH